MRTRFGNWTALESRGRRYLCRCVCGVEKEVLTSSLYRGASTSCGCRQSWRSRPYPGHTKWPEYVCWAGMRRRCNDPSDVGYADYGGRGITVCARWNNSFDAFLADMGRRPGAQYSLDRIDVNGDYSPHNCRWATRAEQVRNTRRAVIVNFRGQEMPLAQVAAIVHLPYDVLWHRLRSGWDQERALNTPVKGRA